MTSAVPPRDWTDIHWPDISGADVARWIAVLPLAATEQHGPHLPLGTDVMIAQAYLERVRELLPDSVPVTFLPVQPIGISTEHIDYPGTLTLPTETALKKWMAIGDQRRARRHQKACAGDKPRRQQRRHDLGRARFARGIRRSRGHHRLVALRRAGRIVLGRGIASRHSRRRGRNIDHAGAISASGAQRRDRGFPFRGHCDGKEIIAGFPRIGRRRSPGRRRTFIQPARSATRRRHPRRKAGNCSITARPRFVNCSPISINSIRQALPDVRAT